MSMDNKNLSNLTLFGNVPIKYCEQKKGLRKTFHESIQKNKDFLFNFFDSQPYYNEFMSVIMKNSRGNNFYKKIIKNGVRKSNFFKGIMKAVNDIGTQDDYIHKEKKKLNGSYKIPKLELLKKRKQKYEIYLKKKNKVSENNNNYNKFIKKNNSMTQIINIKEQPILNLNLKSTFDNNIINNDTNNNNNINNNISSISIDTFHTINNKNESMTNFNNNLNLNLNSSKSSFMNLTKDNSNSGFYNIKNSRNIKNKNKSIKDLKQFFSRSQDKLLNYKTFKLGKILNKCNEELNYAQNVEDKVQKYNKNKTGEEIGQKIRNGLKNKDQKIIEDNGVENKKYKKLEKEKFNELKKKINIIKVSEDYAYINRKELHEFMRDNENILAYQIYLKDMNKLNEKFAKKKEIEKKNISLIQNMLEDDFKKKEFLKYKIDNYHRKNVKQDELKKFRLKNMNDHYENKNHGDKEVLNGTLLPKLIALKDYCYGRPKYNKINDINNENKEYNN